MLAFIDYIIAGVWGALRPTAHAEGKGRVTGSRKRDVKKGKVFAAFKGELRALES